jgi:hypothetical protein
MFLIYVVARTSGLTREHFGVRLKSGHDELAYRTI